MTQDDSATIASVSDQDWYVSRTYGVFHIPACEKGKEHSLLMILPRGDALDLGDNRRFPFTITAREIALDLVQDLAAHGVFVCDGARPSEQEIGAASSRRDAWYQQLVFDGDQMWSRSHNYQEISDQHRRAALALGLEREWAYGPRKMIDCPVCGERIRPGVAIRKHCGAVLDAEKAALHGMQGSENGRKAATRNVSDLN
jgi:hypothetical protein